MRAPTNLLSTWVASVREERRRNVEKRLVNMVKFKRSAPAERRKSREGICCIKIRTLNECKERGRESASPDAGENAEAKVGNEETTKEEEVMLYATANNLQDFHINME